MASVKHKYLANIYLAVKLVLAAALIALPMSTRNAPMPISMDKECLATAIHYEARGEPLRGQRAVLDTIYNRMYTSGQNACLVIYKHGQFSWTKYNTKILDRSVYITRLEIVQAQPIVLNNGRHMFFYSGPKPAWAYGMICRRIDGHNFCKSKDKND